MKESPPGSRGSADLLPKGRLEAFADGVLAIVITILVLELEVPGRSEGAHLADALADDWRAFAGYLISFVFVGGVWIAHSNATRLIERGDALLFRLNLLQLFFVSLLPFTTSLMTSHLGGDGEGLAATLYGLDLLLASVMLSVMIRYLANNRHLVPDEIADEELLEIERQRRGSVAVLMVATALAISFPTSRWPSICSPRSRSSWLLCCLLGAADERLRLDDAVRGPGRGRRRRTGPRELPGWPRPAPPGWERLERLEEVADSSRRFGPLVTISRKVGRHPGNYLRLRRPTPSPAG